MMPAAVQISQLEKFVRHFAALTPAEAEATLVRTISFRIEYLKRTQLECEIEGIYSGCHIFLPQEKTFKYFAPFFCRRSILSLAVTIVDLQNGTLSCAIHGFL